MFQFKNLKQLEQTLNTQEKCLDYYESVRFEEGYFCPHCGSTKFWKLSKIHTYKCASKECLKRFNVLTGTIFENTKISLPVWFTAIYLISSHKKGISSLQLASDLGITQKSAWFILHRIREMMRDKAPRLLTGTIEADESYVGGKLSNKHESKINRLKTQGRGIDYQPIVSVLERGGQVRTVHTPDVSGTSIYKVITENVERGETLITDGFTAYNFVGRQYNHIPVKHNKNRVTYGEKHTNNVEGYFSHFKRMIYGTYHWVSTKHLQRYCDEMDFRFNFKKLNPLMRFDEALRQNGTRLTYAALTKAIK